MCLRTLQTSPEKAEEDITCYKVLTEDLKSPCYGQQYELGKLIKSELVLTHRALCDTINEGLHTYNNKDDAITATHLHWASQNNWTDEDGIYTHIVVECIIPKGSEYYAGETFVWCLEYASNQLIPKKIVYDATKTSEN